MGCPYSKADRLPTVGWSNIARTAKTGDILLFGGQSLFSLAEEFVTATPYSHVAMFYRDPTSGKLYVAESSGKDGMIDFFTGRDKSGPRLVDAQKKVLEYSVKWGWGVVIRRLQGATIEKLRNDPMQMVVLFEWMKEQSPKGFEMHKWELGESFVHRKLFARGQDSCSWFCSEYIAAAWQKMGIPMINSEPDQYSPQDFAQDEEDLFSEHFNSEAGGYLGPEVLIVDDRGTVTV